MKKSKTAMDWYILIGEVLVLICMMHSLISIIVNLVSNQGINMLADIICFVAEIAIAILVKIYFKDEEMYELPAVAMIIFMSANFIRVFGISWSYLFYIIPVILMVLVILYRWNVLGIAAGGSMILVNIIVTIIVFYTSNHNTLFSSYFCLNLINNNSLMGIAGILFYLVVKETRGPMMGGSRKSSDVHGGIGGGMSW